MQTLEKCAFQGDLGIFRIKEIPDDTVKVESVGGDYVVAHSETGHNHVVSDMNAVLYNDASDDLVAYLDVTEDTELRHLRTYRTHETIKITPGKYTIRRQRERTPEGYRRAAD